MEIREPLRAEVNFLSDEEAQEKSRSSLRAMTAGVRPPLPGERRAHEKAKIAEALVSLSFTKKVQYVQEKKHQVEHVPQPVQPQAH